MSSQKIETPACRTSASEGIPFCPPARVALMAAAAAVESGTGDPLRRPLYRLASFPVRLYRRLFAPPEPPLESGEYYPGPEIRTALRDPVQRVAGLGR